MTHKHTEVTTFKTLPGVTDEVIRRAIEDSEFFLLRTSGFISRDLLRSSDSDEWVTIGHWQDAAAFQKALPAFFAAPETQAFLNCVDRDSVKIRQLIPFHQCQRVA
jgi:heme-degrading monooxygenase HmoA